MADNLLKVYDLYPKRDRLLEDISRHIKAQPTSQENVDALFSRAAFIANKSTYLMLAVKEVAEKYYIPVPDDYQEIQAALKRRTTDSEDGTKITFSMFSRCVDISFKQRLAIQDELTIQKLSMPGQTLSKKLCKLRKRIYIEASGGSVTDEVLEDLAKQFIILFFANLLLTPLHAAMQDIPAFDVLTKDTNKDSSVGISITNMLIGLAVQFYIMQLNEEKMEEYLKLAAGERPDANLIDYKGIVAKAKQLKSSKEIGLLDMYLIDADYENILRYSIDYIAESIEPGYSFWLAYIDAQDIRYTAQNLWTYAPYYSVKHSVGNQFVKKPKRLKQDLDIDDELAIKQNVIDSIVNMGNDTYSVFNEYLEESNTALDTIAQVLGSDFVQESIICLSAFLRKIPEDTLRLIKSILEALLRAYQFDIRELIKSILAKLTSPNIEELLTIALMAEIEKIMDKLKAKLLSLFGEDVEKFLCCPLLGELIARILQILNKIEAQLKGAIKIFLKGSLGSFGLSVNSSKKRHVATYDQRIIYKFVLIIDYVLSLNNYLDGDYEIPEETKRLLDLPKISLPDKIKEGYFLSAEAKELTNGKYLPKLGDSISSLTVDTVKDSFDNLMSGHTCAKGFDSKELDKLFTG